MARPRASVDDITPLKNSDCRPHHQAPTYLKNFDCRLHYQMPKSRYSKSPYLKNFDCRPRGSEVLLVQCVDGGPCNALSEVSCNALAEDRCLPRHVVGDNSSADVSRESSR